MKALSMHTIVCGCGRKVAGGLTISNSLLSCNKKPFDYELSPSFFCFLLFCSFLSSPLEWRVEYSRLMPLFGAPYSRRVRADTPKPFSDGLDAVNGTLFPLLSTIFKRFPMHQNVVTQLLSRQLCNEFLFIIREETKIWWANIRFVGH